MNRRATFAVALSAAVLCTACSSAGGPGGATRSRDVITAEELTRVPHSSVYEAVRALRPRWLQPRGGASIRNATRETARVYMDGQLFGSINDLWSLVPGEIGEIRYLSSSDATTRFGTNHIGGAIVIQTRRR